MIVLEINRRKEGRQLFDLKLVYISGVEKMSSSK